LEHHPTLELGSSMPTIRDVIITSYGLSIASTSSRPPLRNIILVGLSLVTNQCRQVATQPMAVSVQEISEFHSHNPQ
jgi:hypothetical protein